MAAAVGELGWRRTGRRWRRCRFCARLLGSEVVLLVPARESEGRKRRGPGLNCAVSEDFEYERGKDIIYLACRRVGWRL